MGANETAPAYHSFVGGCYLHEDAYGGAATLVSFHLGRFLLFNLMVAIAGPLVYRLVAAFFDLERDFKSVVDHFDDFTGNLLYTYLVFTLGNYAHTFGWVTLVFYFVGLLCYSVLVELPFLRVSLPGWRSWGRGAWVTILSGLAAVLVAAGFHIRWACKAGILQWYLPLFVLATASVWSTAIVHHLHERCLRTSPEGLGIERRLRRAALRLFTRRSARSRREFEAQEASQLQQLRARAEQHAMASVAPALRQDSPDSDTTDNRSEPNGEGVASASRSLLNMPIEPQRPGRIDSLTHEQKAELIEMRLRRLHYLNARSDGSVPLHRFALHLHHWQMFYILAFFTRFDEFASKMCAGLVLGIFTQGVAAYGFDATFEHKGEYTAV
ncbi:hypothetical protein GGI07_003169 [Coemansia sp. Benny D115]|nr:hypothetical protein GGI07_003169 [Coemansia sp. Benny D115]